MDNNSIWMVELFSDLHIRQWDEFVMNNSLNGTFLHTRNFLNYHKAGKFEDMSLEIYKKNKLVAVCPACLIHEDGKNVFYSHKGSTYGGIVFSREIYRAQDIMKLVEVVEHYLRDKGINKIIMRLTPDIYCKSTVSLFEYMLRYYGYFSYVDLNTYVDLECDDTEIRKKIDRNKKRNIDKCEDNNLWFHKLDTNEELTQFYQLLKVNLYKYGVKPIHSLDEILEFHQDRLKNQTLFYGVGKKNQLLAAGMMFVFERTKILHAQNLSYNPFVKRDYSPITYLYYKIIMQAKKKGFSKLTWGISTEECGKKLNMGLIRNKESYGSEYFLNAVYFKILTE